MPYALFLNKLNHASQKTKYIGLLVLLCLLAIIASIFLTQSHKTAYQASDNDLANLFIEGFETINHEYRECIAQHDDSNIEADIACIATREEKAQAMQELMQKIKGVASTDDYHHEYRDEHAHEYHYQYDYRAEHKGEYELY